MISLFYVFQSFNTFDENEQLIYNSINNNDEVLIVKKYLDANFKKGNLEGIGEDGMPSNTPIVVMINTQTGKPAQNMFDYQLHELLIDKFQNMFTDKDERSKFLGQVMRDWYEDKIGLYGSLSVNHL